jgi:hypothetical protein
VTYHKSNLCVRWINFPLHCLFFIFVSEILFQLHHNERASPAVSFCASRL